MYRLRLAREAEICEKCQANVSQMHALSPCGVKLKYAPNSEETHDPGSGEIPAQTSSRPSRWRPSLRQIRRCRKRPAREAARRKARQISAHPLDAARTPAHRAMGHSRIQPQCGTRFSELAEGILAEGRSPADRRSVEQEHPAI